MSIAATDVGGAPRLATTIPSDRTPNGPRGNVEFDGKGLAFPAAKGVLLTILTFSIYRFWLITDLRRWFWSRTRIGGSPLEYTGTGIEIFIGFLAAMAIFLPVYVVLGVLAGIWISESLLTLVTLVLVGALYFYVIYRARRYRLNRTLWRGLRFGLEGSPWAYAGRGILWSLALIPTFGLAYPWMAAALERYRIDHMRFAGNAFHSKARGRDLLVPYLTIYAVSIVGLGLLGALMVALSGGMNEWNAGRTSTGPGSGFVPLAYFTAVPIWAAAIALALVYFRARKLSRFGSAIRLGEVAFDLVVPARRLVAIAITYALMMAGIAVLVGVGAAALAIAALGADTQSLSAAVVIGQFAAVIGIATTWFWLKIVYYQRAIWRVVAHGLIIRNLDQLDTLVAKAQQEASGRDEGFADALTGEFEIGF